MKQSVLAINNLSKTYRKSNIEVLKNISLNIKSGEFVSIIGPSGCGKSTLLSILAGVEKQTSGDFSNRGETSIRGLTSKYGYMPQQATLMPWITVLENVALGLQIRNFSKKEREEKALILLKHFKLDSFAHMYPKTLSGGMSQRVALLRTILFNQDFLLLDEPFGALDALTRISCQEWLLSVWQEYKSTVLLVTHDIREAIFLSDRIFVMGSRPGEIVKEIIVDIPRPRKQKEQAGKKVMELEKELIQLLI